MGTITQRKLANGTVRFRAEIRIKRSGYPEYKESKTFGTKRTAENWLKTREAEIENNPKILFGVGDEESITVGNAIQRYIDEIGASFSRTKVSSLILLTKLPIAKVQLVKLGAAHLDAHVKLRKNGVPKLGLNPIQSSTILNEVENLKSVLIHAKMIWRYDVNVTEYSEACLQLRKTRQLVKANRRDRLPTTDELVSLLKHYKEKWDRGRTAYPMHLIVLFAIFSCRRQSEITRISLKDYDTNHQQWKVRDLKNPSGKGMHKDFTVNDDCKVVIDLLLDPEVRARMLKMNGDADLLVPLSPVAIASEFNQSCNILGINDFRFHDLRHEGATRLAESGLTIPQIQQVTLHNTWSSLERYVSVRQRRGVLSLSEMLHLIGEM